MSPALSASPTGRSTRAGSIGRRKRSCLTKNAPTTGRMCFDGKLGGSRPANAKPERIFSRGTNRFVHLADNLGNGLSSYFPAWLRDEGFRDCPAATRAAPTFRTRPTTTLTARVLAWTTCSTMFSPSCTTRPTASPMPGRCEWSGRGYLCRAGQMARRKAWQRPWFNQRHMAGRWRPCWTRTPPSGVLPRVR